MQLEIINNPQQIKLYYTMETLQANIHVLLIIMCYCAILLDVVGTVSMCVCVMMEVFSLLPSVGYTATNSNHTSDSRSPEVSVCPMTSQIGSGISS